LAKEKDRIFVVEDQIGSPKWLGWAAYATAEALRHIRAALDREVPPSTDQIVVTGPTSWYGFA
jgi:dTDP-4-dehydrorhamnose reductase